MSQVIEALKWRYAVKKFDAKKIIPEADLEILKNAFNLTATSFGLQPVRLLIVSDKELQKELVPASMGQQQVGDASHILVFCIEKQVDGAYVEAYFDNVKQVRSTPDEILAPFKNYLLDHFGKSTPAENDVWAAKQAYLAMGNLLTVCAMQEIDACPMEGFDSAAYTKILELSDKKLAPVLVMPVGYRAQDDMFAEFKKVRKPLENAVLEY